MYTNCIGVQLYEVHIVIEAKSGEVELQIGFPKAKAE